MTCSVVDQNIDMRQREVVLRASLIQVAKVDAHSNLYVFLGHRDNVGEPFRICRHC